MLERVEGSSINAVNSIGYTPKNNTNYDLTSVFVTVALKAVFPDTNTLDYLLDKENVEPLEDPGTEITGFFSYRQPNSTTTDKKTSTITKKYVNEDGSYTLVKEKDFGYNLLSVVLTGTTEGQIIEEYDKNGNLIKETKYSSNKNNSTTTTYSEDGKKTVCEVVRDFDDYSKPKDENSTAIVTLKKYNKDNTYTQYDYEENDGKIKQINSSYHCTEVILSAIFGIES